MTKFLNRQAMGIACLIVDARLHHAFPSSALPASGFVGIISARDIKAPLTARKDNRLIDMLICY